MKKVLLLGDSIRMGYDSIVKEMLEGKAEVFYDDFDNGRFSSYTLWQANQMMRKFGKFDIVHFNNGYWDMHIEAPMTEPIHPIPEYLSNLRRIVELCRTNGATVIFASTVPVCKEGEGLDNTGTGANITYKNEWVVEYNKHAKALMEELGVIYNDLYEAMLKDDNCYKCSDSLHLTEEGYTVCAKQIVDIIEGLL